MDRKQLWNMGFSDDGIAAATGDTREEVRIWRERLKLCSNPGQRREKTELARLLPKVGDKLLVRPTVDGTPYEEALPAVVIHVNTEHLHYTVRFIDFPWLKESYRVI